MDPPASCTQYNRGAKRRLTVPGPTLAAPGPKSSRVDHVLLLPHSSSPPACSPWRARTRLVSPAQAWLRRCCRGCLGAAHTAPAPAQARPHTTSHYCAHVVPRACSSRASVFASCAATHEAAGWVVGHAVDAVSAQEAACRAGCGSALHGPDVAGGRLSSHVVEQRGRAAGVHVPRRWNGLRVQPVHGTQRFVCQSRAGCCKCRACPPRCVATSSSAPRNTPPSSRSARAPTASYGAHRTSACTASCAHLTTHRVLHQLRPQL
jgi:hypothetical protein